MDVKKRYLPNREILILLVIQLVFLISNKSLHLNSAIIVLLLGFILYMSKIVAAGDVKLAFSMAIAVKPEYLGSSVLLMLFIGGIQALYYLIKHYLFLYFNGRSDVLEFGLPYGVAICIGFYTGALLTIT